MRIVHKLRDGSVEAADLGTQIPAGGAGRSSTVLRLYAVGGKLTNMHFVEVRTRFDQRTKIIPFVWITTTPRKFIFVNEKRQRFVNEEPLERRKIFEKRTLTAASNA